MTDKKLRRLYLAVKALLLAASLVALFCGMHFMPMEPGDASAPFLFWLSGMLMWGFATLEE